MMLRSVGSVVFVGWADYLGCTIPMLQQHADDLRLTDKLKGRPSTTLCFKGYSPLLGPWPRYVDVKVSAAHVV